MAHFILKTGPDDEGKRYEVPTVLTIGEQRDIFREFGPDAAAVGVIWIAVRREFPSTTVADIENCTAEMFEDEEDKLPPTFASGSDSAGENGSQTELADTGTLGSDSTTA